MSNLMDPDPELSPVSKEPGDKSMWNQDKEIEITPSPPCLLGTPHYLPLEHLRVVCSKDFFWFWQLDIFMSWSFLFLNKDWEAVK